MKKYALTLILAIVCASGLKAQTEFAPLGATWYYSVADEYGDPLSDYEKYVSVADTLIDGKTCRVVESASDTLIFYNDNGKVYNWFCDHFLLTYDFSAQTGDTIAVDFRANKPNSITTDTFYTVQCVVKIDTLADSHLKHFELDMIPRSDLPDYHFGRYSYVENVGYETEPMYILTNLASPDITIGTCYLRCYEDNLLKYTSNWWKSQNKDCDNKEADATLTVDCGENIVICPDDVYAFYNEGVDTLYIGRNVEISKGKPPYTYAWTCKPQEQGLKTITASDLLSDTTIVNPYFIREPADYKCVFNLKVTDANGNEAVDSLSVLFETFTYFTDDANNLAERTDGNQIYLTGEQKNMLCLFPPMSYFAVIESDTIALPAYITIQETDSVTIFGIDSIGCHDYPHKYWGKWLLVSIDEKNVEADVVKLIANTMVFSDDSEKQIRIYSTIGQLLYSKFTTDTRFDIPSLNNVNHCVCSVIINNKKYSYHLFRP